MRSIRCGVIEGLIQLREALLKPRTLILLAAVIVVVTSSMTPLVEFAEFYEDGLRIAEPFIISVNQNGVGNNSSFFPYMVFIIILSDLPLFKHGFRYRMMRMDRRAWVVSQLTVAILFSLMYLLLMMAMYTVPLIGNLSVGEGWSIGIQHIATGEWQEIAGIPAPGYSIQVPLLRMNSLNQAFWQSCEYSLMYLLFSALFISAVHMLAPRIRPMAVGIMGCWYLLGGVLWEPGLPDWLNSLSLVSMSRLVFTSNLYMWGDMPEEYITMLTPLDMNIRWGVALAAVIITLIIAVKRFKLENLIEKEG